ncbi:MAG: 1,4-alpha-glucan branching protein GlgB [Burkholderiales bacterium]
MPLGSLYKFEIRNRHHGAIMVKTDPYGTAFELRPGTAARICGEGGFTWSDAAWMEQRARSDWLHAPMNIYEVHLGSWKQPENRDFYNYRELADLLLPYVLEMGYTHIELMPISEHPLDESWGYQTTGYYGVTSRYGAPDDFRAFVDRCHDAGIGVILDWVPGHFPKDAFALARFDGSALYEHEDPRLGEHQDWGTYIFNYGRNEVRGFLIGNAHYWLSEFHIDGLRVDAVASMLYLDYSRKPGEWLPNANGGRENLDALAFIREVNMMVHQQFPGVLTIAEESTSWPMVSRPIYLGGLGFSMKWNMGWMNDTLHYFSLNPVHRRHHHRDLTFFQLYAYTENFVLPFSHDEVVHGKHSLLDKMPGDVWQRFANLRLLMIYQMTSPGKKLNFMGNEFGQGSEWRVKSGLDWSLLAHHWHQGIQNLCRDLNHRYRDHPALHDLDFESIGFSWVDCDNADQSVLSFVRRSRSGAQLVIALNFTPVPRTAHRLGVPTAGQYREMINSDSTYYGGGNLGNGTGLLATATPWNGQPYSLTLTLPPLAGLILESC